MWEPSIWRPQGSISLRKIFAFATALFVACFVYIVASAPAASAADAEWDNGAISYNSREYRGPIEVKEDGKPPEMKKGGKYYISVEESRSMPIQKAAVIYFAPGSDPGSADNGRYSEYTYSGPSADGLSDPSDARAISIDSSTYTAPVNEGTSSCVIEGIGFLVCPLTSFMARGMDFVYSLVDGFLEVRPLATTQDQALFRAWSFMRTFANVAFVIAFLIIIYSQVSNFGMSNYSMKKLLPRIAIAAILVNISYWICAVAVDVFNILGYSIQDLFIMMRNSLVGTEGNGWDVISWESFASLILSGGSAVAGIGIAGYLGVAAVGGVVGVAGLIYLLLPILLSVLFVILMTFLILAARQAIITVLIIIAPLAFVAYLLPNTEKWFEKWRSALLTLLLVFPAFSLVFGGSQLAAAAIIQNATSLNIILLGMAVQVIPLAIMPLLLKFGGGILNRFAGVVNNPTKGIFDRGKNWSKERLEANQAAKAKRVARDPSAYRRYGASRIAYNRAHNKRVRDAWKSANEEAIGEAFHGTEAYNKIDQAKRMTAQDKMRNEGEHEAHWYRQFDRSDIHFDQRLLEREAVARAAVTGGADTKKLMDIMEEEMKAGKNPIHARGYQDVPSSELANAITKSHTSAQSIAINGMREAATRNQAQSDIASVLQNNTTLQEQAGGIQSHGAEIAKATAESTRIAESAKAIKAYEDASPVKAGDINGMRAEFDDAVATGNIEKVRAYTNIMANSSNPGIKALRESLKAHEFTMPPDMKEVLKIHIDSHSGINGAAEDIGTWSRDVSNTRSLAQISSDPATWSGLSATQFASMKKSSQIEALNAGGVPEDIALAVWNGPAAQNLKTDADPESNVQARIKALAMQAQARQQNS